MNDFNAYQFAAQRTLDTSKDALDGHKNCIAEFGFGLTGETGEVVDALKKYLWHGHPLDMEKLKKEIGDVLWYLSAICTVLGIDLGQVAGENIAKLLKRYPAGFSNEASRERIE